MDNRVVIILPNHVLVKTVEDALARMDLEFPIYQMQTEEALELAREKINRGAQLIISRGMTADYLRTRVNIPILEIKYDFFHFANSMRKALDISSEIAVIGFIEQFRLAERARVFVERENEHIQVHILSDKGCVEEKIIQLAQQGIHTFVGGFLVVETSRKLGFSAVLVETDNKAVEEAIHEALYELRITVEREERFGLINSILNSASNGIFAVNAKGNITVHNPIAQAIMQKGDPAWLEKPIQELMPKSMLLHTLETGCSIHDDLVNIGDSIVAANSEPILVEGKIRGAVVTIQEAGKIQKLDYKIRKKLMLKGHIAVKILDDIIGDSAAINECKNKAKSYAKVDSTVLILGETGTGKELFAQSIHNLSRRVDRPFVAVNCAALSPSLLESELFGYVKGAFTGARNEGKAGIFELAHTGTIFLDEVGEIPLELQSRLLRVIQEKQVTRIGDDRVIPVDVRILTATNRNLAREVAQKNFREDLYYRLNVLELRLPSLVRRREDIPMLVVHFVRQKCAEAGFAPVDADDGVLSLFRQLPLKGNIRELANLVERALVIGEFAVLDESCLRQALYEGGGDPGDNAPQAQADAHTAQTRMRTVADMELEMIVSAIEKCGGNKSAAARMLGMSQSTLWRRLRDMNK